MYAAEGVAEIRRAQRIEIAHWLGCGRKPVAIYKEGRYWCLRVSCAITMPGGDKRLVGGTSYHQTFYGALEKLQRSYPELAR